MQSVKFHMKDLNPFYTLLVGAWDSRKINHLDLTFYDCKCFADHPFTGQNMQQEGVNIVGYYNL